MPNQCRLCAKFTQSSIDLFLQHETSLLTKINSFLPLTIAKDESLPMKICCKCVEQSIATHSFIQQILMAQELFGISKEPYDSMTKAANSVTYGGITISSMNKTNINVSSSSNQRNHKKQQNVTETLKKLKKMQTGNLTISKTFVAAPKSSRKCKTEPKYYQDIDDDDGGDRDDDGHANGDGDYGNGDDEDNDPSFDVVVSDRSASDDDDDNDDDEDYKPYAKKAKASNSKPKNSQQLTEPNSKLESIKVSAPPVFLCMKCRNKFQTLAELKMHVFQKNACTQAQLKCTVCEKAFETKKKLSQHLKTHEEKAKFMCDKCGKVYTNQYNLENHKSSQHGEYLKEDQNVYKCRLCGEKFSNRTDLYMHMKDHPKEPQQLLCDTCGKCFTNAHNLKSHIRVHLDIRPFECTLCPKRFRTRLLLRQHLHVHTGIKEFQCMLCNQSFAKKDSLRVHMKNRHAAGNPIVEVTTGTPPSDPKPIDPKLPENPVKPEPLTIDSTNA